MTLKLQPLTLQITTSPVRLHAQLLAAWPRAAHSTRRTRAVRTITNHIKDALPADHQGDISVFVSNEMQNAQQDAEGFLYHLTHQNIVKRKIFQEANPEALLYIHYEAASAMDEIEQEQEEPILQSRIEQIKQWQKETVKSVLQCMADTALSMEAQTALRGAMAGLNKLGALLNKTTAVKGKNHITTAVQKAVSRDIASTLSNLRSSLNVASTSHAKPPTKAQLAIRQQLKKLGGIVPVKEKPALKSTAKVALNTTVKQTKTVSIKTTPIQKPMLARVSPTRIAPSIVTRPVSSVVAIPKRATASIARVNIKTIRAIGIAKPAVRTIISTRSQQVVTPRVARIPSRIVTRIMAHNIQRPADIRTRFTARATTSITQKISQTKAITPAKAPRSNAPQRATQRFHINRNSISTLRVTPSVITAYKTISTRPAQAAPNDKTVQRSNVLKSGTSAVLNVQADRNPSLVQPLPLAQRALREPQRYAAIATSVASPRQIALKANHIATSSIPVWSGTRSVPIPIFIAPISPRDAIVRDIISIEQPTHAPITNYAPRVIDVPIAPVEPIAPPVAQPVSQPTLPPAPPPVAPPIAPPAPINEDALKPIIQHDGTPQRVDNGTKPAPIVPPPPPAPVDLPPTHLITEKRDVISEAGPIEGKTPPAQPIVENPIKPIERTPITGETIAPTITAVTPPHANEPPPPPAPRETTHILEQDKQKPAADPAKPTDNLEDKKDDRSNVVQLPTREKADDASRTDSTIKPGQVAEPKKEGAEIINLRDRFVDPRQRLPQRTTAKLTEQYVDRDRRYSIAYGRTADGSTVVSVQDYRNDTSGSGTGHGHRALDGSDKNEPTKPNKLRFRCPCTGRYL